MIDGLRGRVLELSDADVNLLADPQQPCTLRDHRVADDLVTSLAREVQRLRGTACTRCGGAGVLCFTDGPDAADDYRACGCRGLIAGEEVADG